MLLIELPRSMSEFSHAMTDDDSPFGAKPGAQGEPTPLSGGGLDRIRHISRNFLAANMNVVPLRERALATVERVMDAALQLARQSGAEAVSIPAIARLANMPQMTVYRYFSSPQAVLRLLVRLYTSQSLQLFRDRIIDARYESMEDFVERALAALAEMIASAGAMAGAPLDLRLRLYRDYGELPFDEIWDLADDIANTMIRSGLTTRTRMTQLQIALPLVSAIAMTKMTVVHPLPGAPATMLTKAIRATLLTGFSALILGPDDAGPTGRSDRG